MNESKVSFGGLIGDSLARWIAVAIFLLIIWVWVRIYGITWERGLMVIMVFCLLDISSELTRIRRRLAHE